MLVEEKSKRLFQIYKSAKPWQIIYKLILPSILVALPIGIFVFVDQVFMINLIPKNTEYFSFEKLFNGFIPGKQIDEQKVIDIFNSLKNGVEYYGTTGIVKSAVALSLPITLLFDILPFLISIGAMTIYAKKFAQAKTKELSTVFNSSFWFSLFLGCIFFILIFSLSNVIISSFSTSSTADVTSIQDKNDQDIYLGYLNRFDALSKSFAIKYVQILSISLIFAMVQSTLSILIRVESRPLITIISSIVANCLNILLDYVFLSFTSLGMSAAALATVIGYISGTLILFGYIIYASKKNLLHFHIRDIKLNKTLDFRLFIPIIWISLPIFLVNLLYSVNIAIFLPVFGNTLNQISTNLHSSETYYYYQNLFGGAQAVAVLIFTGTGGIFDGVRGLFSFSLENKEVEYKRIRMLFNLTTIVSIVYGCVMLLLIYLLEYPFYLIIGGSSTNKDFLESLVILSAELPAFALGISAYAYFQAGNRALLTILVSFLQTIIFVIVLFVLQAITLNVSANGKSSMHMLSMVMLMTLWIASFLNSAVLYILGAVFVFKIDKKKRLAITNNTETLNTEALNK